MLVGVGLGAALAPDGHPEPSALIKAGVYDPLDYTSDSVTEYLQGGDHPGRFGRDLSGVINQVPQWAWFTMGGAFLGMAYLSYRAIKRKQKATA